MADPFSFPRSNTLHDSTGELPATVDDLRQHICELTGLPPDEVTEDTDLLYLGMDSIFVMRIAAMLRRRGVPVSYEDLTHHPTTAAWWELIRRHAGNGNAAPAGEPAPPAPVDESALFPLAVMQHAFWIGREPTQRLSGVAAHFYTEFDRAPSLSAPDVQIRATPAIDPDRLDTALRRLIERHGMLRVEIASDGTQRITERDSHPGLTVHDLRDRPATEVERHLAATRDRLSHRIMDIAAGEVFDIQLSLLPGGATRMHVNLDMVAADALSLRTLLADLVHLYESADPLPPIGYSYPRYLAERGHVRRDRREEAREWWQRQLPDLPGAPALPMLPDDSSTGPTVTRRHHWLAPEDVRLLRERARAHGLTPATVLAAAFAETIGAWSATDRFLLNLPVFDREPLHADVDHLVGDFSSSVMLDVDLSEDRPFTGRARQLRDRLRETSSHAEYTGVEVLRDLSRATGEQTLAPVVYTSALDLGDLFSPDVRRRFGEPSWIISQGPQVWLDAQVTEFNGGILVNWDARDSLFPAGLLDAMFGAFVGLVTGLLSGTHPWDAPVPELLPAEQRRVRERVNATDGPSPAGAPYEWFFATAAITPDRPALLWGTDRHQTYGELALRARKVAALLRAHGVRPGDSVGITLPKGPDQVAAVLGVLAAGASYVPSGTDVPRARRERVFGVAGVRTALTDTDHAMWVPDGVRTLVVADADACEPVAAPEPVDPEAVMYTIFTSGSTGDPKGVDVPHRAVANTVAAVNDLFDVGAGDRTLTLSALDFDLSAYDLFAFLGYGGSVVVVEEPHRRDAAAWAEMIRRWDVTVVSCVPALLDMLLVAGAESGLGDSLRLVMLGGDWVTVDLPPRLRAQVPGCRFAGLGGMTEAAIHATVCEVGDVDPEWRAVPYGMPLRNVACRVADSHGHDRPDLVPGELWVSGAGVAHGYRGDPERTAAKFVERDGRRWYRTGDLARHLPDGTLEFLGRTDHQVKIRGHRIELGEIESHLAAHPRVDKAVAAVVEKATRRLAAAVVTAGPIDPEELRAWLADRLPGFMVPDRVQPLDAFPITRNGKIDRAAIRDLLFGGADAADVGRDDGDPPAGPVEEALADIWRDLLGATRVCRTDSFFALGGDSLLATRLMRRLAEAGLAGAELARLFATPVLHEFAATLCLSETPAPEPAAPLPADPERRHDPFPLTDIQRAFWIGRDPRLALGGVGSHFYLELDGADVDVDRLEEAWNRLVARHEMLRVVVEPDGTQRILPEVPRYRIALTDAGRRPEAALHRLRQTLSRRVADPGAWPLFEIRAARYTRDGQRRTRLYVSLDSIVMDGRSIMVVYTEWDRLYRDPDAALSPLEVSFRDYVLNAAPDPREVEAADAHWRRRAAELPPAPALPLAVDPAEVRRPLFGRLRHEIDAERWRRVTARARRHGLTPNVVLLACYTEVLAAWSDQRDLTVNVTLFDRRDVHPHIDHVVGDFAALLMVGHRAAAEGESFAAVARRLQERQGRDLAHRAASGVRVLREIARRDGTVTAAMPVVFTSVLGVGDDASLELSEEFPEQVYGLTQTPQVWLDCKVGPWRGGVTVDWDAVEELFPDGTLDAMFDAYADLVDALADADWDAPLPPVLTPERRASLDRARAARRTDAAAPATGGATPPPPVPTPEAGADGTPVGAEERTVARLWRDLLGVPQVRRTDSFFTLGGDSILATRLMGRLRAEGLAGAELAQLFATPVLHEFAATLCLSETPAPEPAASLTADPEHRHDPFPLTDVQTAYWLGRSADFTLGDIGAQLYTEYAWPNLDVARLEDVWNRLVARHDMLRVTVEPDGTQRVRAEVPRRRIPVVDVSTLGAEAETVLARVREEMAGTTPGPGTWPVGLCAIHLPEGRSRVALVFDNIAVDGLSILTLLAECHRLYSDPDAELPPLGLTFRDYVLGRAPDTAALERSLTYWRGRLAELPPGPRLPLRVAPGQVRRPRFHRRERRLDPAAWRAITARAREHGLTPSVVLLACYTQILGAWSAQRDLTVNLTLFDRHDVHPDINRVVGDFTSLLLVADRPRDRESWLDRARRLQEQVWRDLDHQEVSAVRVLRELARDNAGPTESVPVVFTSMLGVDDALARSVRWPDHTRSQTPQVWLDHQAIELPDGLLLSWDAVDELFCDGVVDAMLDAYHELLTGLAAADWDAPATVPLPPAQRAVRDRVNTTDGPEPEDTPGGGLLHGAFFAHAAATPGRVALFGGEVDRLSYGELAEWSRRIAALLTERGVRPGDPVAVRLAKGPAQVAALLGVLAAGAAYVPLGVDQPRLRAERILASADARLVLAAEPAPATGATPETVAVGDADRCAPVAEIGGAPDQLAYVIFTSGSTGEPKGVEMTHRAAANTLDDLVRRYRIGSGDRVVAVSAHDFDLSVFDVFGLLGAGGGVILVDEADRRDARRWLEMAHQHGATVWNTVPAMLDMLLTVAEDGCGLPATLRLALASGDWVGLDLPGRLATQSGGACRLVALGGATEAAIWSNAYDVDRVEPGWASIPYGLPLRNQRFRVVGAGGEDRPDWVPGELWIGGTGVARGYRGDPDLTAERFVEHDRTRWYRTGDLGRYRPDGVLEFLGRQDTQVKLRGHRIELGEIEAALAAHPGVAQAVATIGPPPPHRRHSPRVEHDVTPAEPGGRAADAREPAAPTGPRRLVAFVRPETPGDAAGGTPDLSGLDLPAFLAERLPGHAIPEIVPVTDFPLTANGKVDRAALAERARPAGPALGAEPPRPGTERRIAELWHELLDQPPADRADNFFALGGDSLTATRLLQRTERAFGVELSLRAFFAAPSLAALSAAVDDRAGVADLEEGTL